MNELWKKAKSSGSFAHETENFMLQLEEALLVVAI